MSIDGFDTHSDQKGDQDGLLTQLAGGISRFFSELADTGHDKRVLLVTFSEFGRRVRENDSKGTDHGSGSCMFAVGPGVKAGLAGKHPSLEPGELAAGDLKFHTDFRRVYATILDKWLGCDSLRVLGEQFEPRFAGVRRGQAAMALPYAAEWRWLRERTDSPWYPNHRLFGWTAPLCRKL